MSRRHLVAPLGPSDVPPSDVELRAPTNDDVEELARLMLEAYRGTTDADGSETLADARDELRGYFDGRSGEPLVEHSLLALDGARIVSALLVSRYEGRPLIAYTFTGARHKGRGLATALLRQAMVALHDAGEAEVHLWVSAGNTPAEGIYERLGFAEAPVSPRS